MRNPAPYLLIAAAIALVLASMSAKATPKIAAPAVNEPQAGLPVVYGYDHDQDGTVDEEAPALLRLEDPVSGAWRLVAFPMGAGTQEILSAHESAGPGVGTFWTLR